MQTVTEFKKTDKGLKSGHRKNNLHKEFKVISPDLKEVISCRLYWPGERCYCCIWVYTKDTHSAGSDWSGGYGYHKESAAVAGALSNAGYKFTEGISGVGDSAISDALLAVAEYHNIKGCKVFTSHP